MKKILIILGILFTTALSINAEIIPHTVYGITTNPISYKTLKVNQNISLIAFDDYEINENILINADDTIIVKIKKYIQPKRGKRDGYFEIEYIKSVNEQTGKETKPLTPIYGKMRISTPKDIHSMAKQAGISVVGHVLKVPGFSQAIAVSKGLIKPNENQTRIKSAGENLYKSTPLTYVETGKNFEIDEDGIVVLKLKVQE